MTQFKSQGIDFTFAHFSYGSSFKKNLSKNNKIYHVLWNAFVFTWVVPWPDFQARIALLTHAERYVFAMVWIDCWVNANADTCTLTSLRLSTDKNPKQTIHGCQSKEAWHLHCHCTATWEDLQRKRDKKIWQRHLMNMCTLIVFLSMSLLCLLTKQKEETLSYPCLLLLPEPSLLSFTLIL